MVARNASGSKLRFFVAAARGLIAVFPTGKYHMPILIVGCACNTTANIFGPRARGTVVSTLCIIARGVRISSIAVAHTHQGEFTPAPGRVVGSGPWQAKTPKLCTLAKRQRTPRESR